MKLSIIVPVYNTEKYFKRCIDSLLNQSYKDIEIIIVNDNSPGNLIDLFNKHYASNEKIIIVNNSENIGLYASRIKGSKIASGDYITFIDSDDYVSLDGYRLAIDLANKDLSDIVMYKHLIDKNGKLYKRNMIDFSLNNMSGDDYREKYFNQQGKFYPFQLIWNKVYSRNLWQNCLDAFEEYDNHIIMGEDILFSTILALNCNKFSFLNQYCVFYNVRSSSSTVSSKHYSDFKKNFNDIITVFKSIDSYLNKIKKIEIYESNIMAFKINIFDTWKNTIDGILSPTKSKTLTNHLLVGLGISKNHSVVHQDFSNDILSDWNNERESLIFDIMKTDNKVIVFEMFDTLIQQPFLEKEDLFYFLDLYYGKITNEVQTVPFSFFRKKAEKTLQENNQVDMFILDDIYNQIKSTLNISLDVIDKIKNKEIELIRKFSYKRQIMYDMYTLAKYLNKSIVIITQSHYSTKTLKSILNQNSYINFDYIISNNNYLKKSTELNDLKNIINGILSEDLNSVYFIGNFTSEFINCSLSKLNSFSITPSIDFFNENVNGIKTNNIKQKILENSNKFSTQVPLENILFRCMVAVGYNEVFDNPFYSFLENTDFSCDIEMIGYLALAPHVVGIILWLINDITKLNIQTIHFIARDGYLPKKIYDIIASNIRKAPNSNYLELSRKSLFPALIVGNIDKYSAIHMINIQSYTKRKLVEMYLLILKDIVKLEDFDDIETFRNEDEVIEFINYIESDLIDKDKHNEYITALSDYLNQIGDNDVTFDLGYSGRIQAAINKVINKNIDTYFIHRYISYSEKISTTNDFKINTFYDYMPIVSGIVRELFFATCYPSCIGYKYENEQVKLIYEKNSINTNFINFMQGYVEQFSKKIADLFGEYISIFVLSNEINSVIFENFLISPAEKDLVLFEHNYLDDKLFDGNSRINIVTFWRYFLDLKSGQKSLIGKAFFYFKNDKNEFKRRMKIKLSRTPKLYRICSKIYKALKK